jgi:hypothetical protein
MRNTDKRSPTTTANTARHHFLRSETQEEESKAKFFTRSKMECLAACQPTRLGRLHEQLAAIFCRSAGHRNTS